MGSFIYNMILYTITVGFNYDYFRPFPRAFCKKTTDKPSCNYRAEVSRYTRFLPPVVVIDRVSAREPQIPGPCSPLHEYTEWYGQHRNANTRNYSVARPKG